MLTKYSDGLFILPHSISFLTVRRREKVYLIFCQHLLLTITITFLNILSKDFFILKIMHGNLLGRKLFVVLGYVTFKQRKVDQKVH